MLQQPQLLPGLLHHVYFCTKQGWADGNTEAELRRISAFPLIIKLKIPRIGLLMQWCDLHNTEEVSSSSPYRNSAHTACLPDFSNTYQGKRHAHDYWHEYEVKGGDLQ